MTEPNTRTTLWGDRRLDETFRDLGERLRALERVDVALATLDLRVADLIHDTGITTIDIKSIRQDLQTQREQDRRDRRQDRRWIIGTTIAGSGMVIAAIAVILSAAGV